MAEALRLRAAAVVSSLAGADPAVAFAAYDAHDRAALQRVHQRLRAAGDRRRVAEAVVAERVAVERAGEGHVDPALGALFYARWMRGLEVGARVGVARGLDEPDAALVTASTPGARAFDEGHQTAATWLIAQGHRVYAGTPPVRALAALLMSLRDEGEGASPEVLRWERAIRVHGRRDMCAAVAHALEATP